MIIPRFTVRRLLAITAVAAIVFAIASAAFRGLSDDPVESNSSPFYSQADVRAKNPAYALAAISIGVGALVAATLVFAAFFAMAYLTAEIAAALSPTKAAKSPFAAHTPAPQLLPPEEPT